MSRGRNKPARKRSGTPVRPVGGAIEQLSASHPSSPLAIARHFSAQVWKSLGDDDVMFLASGVAFNLLLAVVPFVLLLASVSILFLGSTPDAAADVALGFLDRLLPSQNWTEGDHVRETIREIARVSASVTLYSAIGFLCSAAASYVNGQVLAVDGGFDAAGVGLPTLRQPRAE